MILSGEPLNHKGLILLVDDEEIVLDVGSQMLDKIGYSVFKAKNGKEAIAIFFDKLLLIRKNLPTYTNFTSTAFHSTICNYLQIFSHRFGMIPAKVSCSTGAWSSFMSHKYNIKIVMDIQVQLRPLFRKFQAPISK